MNQRRYSRPDMKTTVTLKPLVETEVRPTSAKRLEDGTLFVDFGRAAYGTIRLPPPDGAKTVVVHLGEKLDDNGRIDREPPGTIRYRRIEQTVEAGASSCRLIIPPDERNTGPQAIKMQPDIGEVFPFRYAEIERAEGMQPTALRQIAVHYPFNDKAADFHSSDKILNAVWDLCKYSIKATTFCGVYVDGDRERIPYEGDAYINQLGHYGTDAEYDFARYSHEYMLQNPTWCTEWHLHSVMMAWADWMASGETTSLETFYEELCAKTLLDFARDDGLISVDPELRTPEMEARLAPLFERGILHPKIRDVMDWPPGSFTDGGTGERDNHEMLPINTVTNAFHAHALRLMSQIAGALDKTADKERFARLADTVSARINELLFDPERGVYVDGEGSAHASLHSNMFPLAFGLVPEERVPGVIDFVKSRGMACSVYGAQHLLDALYRHGEAKCALGLMNATHDRSWYNMIRAGSTMTLEAWDIKYKKNLDWNHAWGAAPANIIPRYIAGVRPLEPGYMTVLVEPQPAGLEFFHSVVPTPRGAVRVEYERHGPSWNITLPAGTQARIQLPSPEVTAIRLNGKTVRTDSHGCCELRRGSSAPID